MKKIKTIFFKLFLTQFQFLKQYTSETTTHLWGVLELTAPVQYYIMCICMGMSYEGGPKNNRNLNVARELEADARRAVRCRESTQYSSSLSRGVSLG